MSVRLVTGLLLACFALGCGTVVQRMRSDIDDGDFDDALLRGQDYLTTDEARADEVAVRALIVEAQFGLARRADSVLAYRGFLDVFGESPFGEQARAELARVEYDLNVSKVDSLQSYQAFLKEFPEGPYAEKARLRAAQLVWRVVDNQGTLEAYQRFRATWGDYAFGAEALRKEMALAWRAAEDEGTPESWLAFAEAYPETDEARAAFAVGERLAWRMAELSDDYLGWLRYLAGYARSHRGERAREIGHRLMWAWAQKTDTVEAYHGLLEHFPDSPHAAAAYAREVELAWQRAESRDDEATYRWFRETYADSEHALLAETRELDLQYFHSASDGEDPYAVVNQVYDPTAERIRLYVQVKDRERGRLIAGLARQDFVVFENGRRADLVDFLGMESNRPVDIVMLVDTSGSMRQEIDGVKTSAIQFAEVLRFRQRDAAFGLVTFTDDVEERFGGRQLTRDVHTFQRWVAGIPEGRGGTENPVQALKAALQYRFRRGAQKVFILLTDEPPNVAFDPKSRLDMAGVAELLAKKDVSTYVITPAHPEYEVLRERTRGAHFDIQAVQQRSFSGLMLHIADLMSMQYNLWYSSPRGLQPGSPRTVRVRAARPKVWISAGTLDARDVIALLTVEGAECGLLAITGSGALYGSTDCAASWEPLPGGPERPLVRAVGRAGEGGAVYLLTADGQVLLLRWADGAARLTRIGEQFGVVEGMGCGLGELGHLWIRAGTEGWLSRNFGAQWTSVGAPPSVGAGWLLAPDPHQPGRVCTITRHGVIWCRDGASDWTQWGRLPLAAAVSQAGLRLRFAPWQSGLAFVTVPGQGLFRTWNGGKDWRRVSLEGGGALGGLWFGGGGQRWVCQSAGGALWCSVDGGASWRKYADGLVWGAEASPLLASVPGGGVFIASPAGGKVFKLFDVANREFVSGQVYFSSGRAEPKRQLLPFLQKLGRALQLDGALRVRVEGHTDGDGGEDYNLDLSRRRAESVQERLIQFGARTRQIETFGYGETRPLFPNDSARNKQRNRRVEILTIRDDRRASIQ